MRHQWQVNTSSRDGFWLAQQRSGYRKPSLLAKGATILTLAFFCLCTMVAAAEDPEVIRLWEGPAPGANGEAEKDIPRLLLHRATEPAAAATGRTAVLVCPGGGYGHLAMGHEGQEIAAWFNEVGITVGILDYRHRGKGYGHPAPLQDAQRGLRQLRAHAADWGLDANRIGVMGFSAGGHLASSLGTHFDGGNADAADGIDRVSCRPDFMILCYPVVALGEPFTHRGSQVNLLGEEASAELVASLSNEKQVSANCPPTFLFHTSEDQAVPVRNSTAFYDALIAANVPAELHVFQKGRHGIGLGRNVPGSSAWPEVCRTWLRVNGWLE